MIHRFIDVLFPPQCAACNAPGSGLCAYCSPPFDAALHRRLPTLDVFAYAPYQGAVRQAILALKDGRRDVAEALGLRLAEVVPPDAVLVPVPTTAARRRTRGMDNVAVLAQITAARAGVGVVDALQRTGADAQRGRSREARLAAVGRFVGDNARVRGQTVVLFDDVCTTGSTLEDCARAIRVAGGRVEKAVVAALA